MIGLLVVTHGDLGRELVNTATMITGPQEGFEGLSIQQTDDTAAASRVIEKAVQRLDKGEGLVIFTDLLGGTPSNVSLTFLNRPATEVVSGVNLPMLLKALTRRRTMSLRPLVEEILRGGRGGITAASLLLENAGGES